MIDSVLYEKLNQVYNSIKTSGELVALANTTLLNDQTFDESLGFIIGLNNQDVNFKGTSQIDGSDFEIQCMKIPKVIGKIEYNIEIE